MRDARLEARLGRMETMTREEIDKTIALLIDATSRTRLPRTTAMLRPTLALVYSQNLSPASLVRVKITMRWPVF